MIDNPSHVTVSIDYYHSRWSRYFKFDDIFFDTPDAHIYSDLNHYRKTTRDILSPEIHFIRDLYFMLSIESRLPDIYSHTLAFNYIQQYSLDIFFRHSRRHLYSSDPLSTFITSFAITRGTYVTNTVQLRCTFVPYFISTISKFAYTRLPIQLADAQTCCERFTSPTAENVHRKETARQS